MPNLSSSRNAELRDFRVSWMILGYSLLFALAGMQNSLGVFYSDMARELNLDDFAGGLIFSVIGGFNFLFSFLAPHALARWGLLRLIWVALGCQICGFLMMIGSEGSVLIWFVGGALFGSAAGLITLAEHVAVYAANPGSLRRKFLSGLHAVYAMASFVFPMLLGTVLLTVLSWQMAAASLVVLPLLVGVWILLDPFGELRPQAFSSQVERAVESDPAATAVVDLVSLQVRNSSLADKISVDESKAKRGSIAASAGDGSSSSSSLSAQAGRQMFVLFVIMMSAQILCEVVVGSRLSVYLQTAVGLDASWGAISIGIFFALLSCGRLLAMGFDHRLGLSSMGTIRLTVALLAVTAGFGWLAVVSSPWWYLGIGLSLAPVFAFIVEWMNLIYGPHAPRYMAYTMGVAQLVIVFGQMLFGLLQQMSGLAAAMWLAPLAASVAFAASLFLIWLEPRPVSAAR